MIKKNITITKCCGVCYYEKDINSIVDFCLKKGFHFYYIKHNAKSDSEEHELKEHWHFIIESDSQHRFIINSLITDTLKENLFEKLNNVHSYLRYMTHIDYIDKEHYDVDLIVSNVAKGLIINYINDVIVDKDLINREYFNALIDLILSGQLLTFKQVMLYCRKNNIEYKISWTNTLVQLLKH